MSASRDMPEQSEPHNLKIKQEMVELTAKCCKLEDLNRKFKDLSWKLYIDLGKLEANCKCMGGDSGLSDHSTDLRIRS